MKRFITICAVLFGLSGLNAQQELSMALMSHVENHSIVNPAYIPENEWTVSLPSFGFSMLHTGPSFNQLFEKQASGKYKILATQVQDQFREKNIFAAGFSGDLLRASYRMDAHVFSLNYGMYVNAALGYTADGANLLLQGNGPFVGKHLNVGPALDIQAYDKLGLGYAYADENWSAGARINFLFGRKALVTSSDQVGLLTKGDYYALEMTSDYVVHSSNFVDVDTATNSVHFADMGYKPGFGGNGFGVGLDIGGSYTLDDATVIWGSITNLGTINWKEGTNYESHTNRTYQGVQIQNLATLDTASLAGMLDSIQKFVGLEKSSASFKSHLSPRIMIGGDWELSEQTKLTGVIDMTRSVGAFLPAIGVGAQQKLADWVQVGGFFSFQNRKINHLGLNTTFRYGPVQLFMATDNIFTFILPKSANTLHFRAGLNIRFGRVMKRSTVYTLG